MRLTDFERRRHANGKTCALNRKRGSRRDLPTPEPRSWANRWLGDRGLIELLFGSFFKTPKNTGGLLALIVTVAVVFTVVKAGVVPDRVMDVVVVIGSFYFGRFTGGRPGSV